MARLAAAQQAVVDRAAQITREKIAPRAAEYDAAGANPVESWREFARDGFLAAAIPRAYGGLGLDTPTYIAVIRAIAGGCASTAMTVHMHSTVMRFIDALATEAQKRRYYREVVEHGRLFGSWGSEPAVSLSRTFLMETVVTQDAGGYVVNGVKYFCTMALGASYYMVWCALDGGTDMGKSKVIQMVGGRGAYKDYPAERAFRDVRTSTLMPPTMDRMLEAIGKSALGLDTAMFNIPGKTSR